MSDELPLIQPGQYKYVNKPQFVKYPYNSENRKWHIFGPEEQLQPGTVVEVEKFSPDADDLKHYEILEHVAYRLVKSHNRGVTKFVMCTFDETLRED